MRRCKRQSSQKTLQWSERSKPGRCSGTMMIGSHTTKLTDSYEPKLIYLDIIMIKQIFFSGSFSIAVAVCKRKGYEDIISGQSQSHPCVSLEMFHSAADHLPLLITLSARQLFQQECCFLTGTVNESDLLSVLDSK